MKIQFAPPYSIDTVIHRNSRVLEKQYPGISTWRYNQIKNIPDDLSFRENRGSYSYQVKLTDDLLSNSFFKIVDGQSTYNPNFVCAKCGAETLTEAIPHPRVAASFKLEIKGERVCEACFKSSVRYAPDGYALKD
jgi:hypothetical protein